LLVCNGFVLVRVTKGMHDLAFSSAHVPEPKNVDFSHAGSQCRKSAQEVRVRHFSHGCNAQTKNKTEPRPPTPGVKNHLIKLPSSWLLGFKII
jgi:hypothetical protein